MTGRSHLRSCAGLTVLCLLSAVTACDPGWHGDPRDFRRDMRNVVQGIGTYARGTDADFIVIPQNGHAILTADGSAGGAPEAAYIGAIDGVGREDLFYGYDHDDQATPAEERDAMLAFMALAEASGVEVLATDYGRTHAKMDDSYAQNAAHGFVSFAADSRDLNTIPDYPANPYDVHAGDVTDLSEAENFLYLLDPSAFATKASYLAAIDATDYDLLIMDLFYEDQSGSVTALSAADLAPLATKANGGARLLVCYMSIGEAEDYRYYWEESWDKDPPSWLAGENPLWRGNYKVEYWDPDWQAIIYGDTDAYLDKIMNAGFDGVYLDIIDAYEYFEEALGL